MTHSRRAIPRMGRGGQEQWKSDAAIATFVFAAVSETRANDPQSISDLFM